MVYSALALIAVFALAGAGPHIETSADTSYRLLGRTGQATEGPTFGWPLAGVGATLSTEETVTLQANLTLPHIDWYDVKGQVEDGVRFGWFIDDAFASDFLVKPGDIKTLREIVIPEGASEVKLLRLSEDLYASGSENAPVFHGWVTSPSSTLSQLPARPTVLFVGDSGR